MNLNADPTKEQLRELLARCDDRAGHHVLWVDRGGEVRISQLPRVWPPPPFEPGPDVQLYHELFEAGKEYFGEEAAADDEWVSELFRVLVELWGKAKGRPRATSFHLFDGIGVVQVREDGKTEGEVVMPAPATIPRGVDSPGLVRSLPP
jgi:hypothetical protein